MATRRGGLGRGLDSLIPTNSGKKEVSKDIEKKESPIKQEVKDDNVQSEVINVKISKVEPDRDQARKHFDKDALNELAASIERFGIIQPLLVREMGDHYELVAGERRWRAAKIAGCKEVPVIVTDYDDAKRVEISLIENLQREDLNPIDEAKAYENLINSFDLTQEAVAERISKSRSVIANSLRLLKLSPNVQQMLIDGVISEGHGRALISLPDEKAQNDLANKVVKEGLNVRETERMVKLMLHPRTPAKRPPQEEINAIIYKDLADQMKGIFGTKVNINQKSGNKGKIEIEYYSQDEFERILALIKSIGN